MWKLLTSLLVFHAVSLIVSQCTRYNNVVISNFFRSLESSSLICILLVGLYIVYSKVKVPKGIIMRGMLSFALLLTLFSYGFLFSLQSAKGDPWGIQAKGTYGPFHYVKTDGMTIFVSEEHYEAVTLEKENVWYSFQFQWSKWFPSYGLAWRLESRERPER